MTEVTAVSYKVWIHRGNMMIRADALDHDDPDHPYNQIVAQGFSPENFGMKHPLTEQFEGWTRSKLIEEVLRLRKEIHAWATSDASGWR